MEDGYSYNLSFEELHNQGFIVDENIKNPKTRENLDGCVVVRYNSSNKGYDVNYDSTCTISGEIKNPTINLTVNTGILNSSGIATNDFDVNVIGTNVTSYTYCVGTTECELTIKVNNSIGTITINNEGINYVCVIGSSEDKNTNKLCKSYKLEKTAVVLGQLVIDGTKGLNDWYVSDVSLSVTDVAGVSSTLNITSITEDTKGTDVIVTSTNTTTGAVTTKTHTIKVDKTKPIAGTATFTGTMGSNSWYTSNVTVNVTDGSDTTSGHASTTSNISSITSNTSGTTVTVTTTDKAGNSSTRTYSIKVDKTKPTLTAKSSSNELAKGTNNTTSSYFNTTYSISGGSLSCNPTNTGSLALGTHTLTCTAIGGNGLVISATTNLMVLYTDGSGANIPTLFANMIPIKYENSKWVYADRTQKWYDYDSQEWANAVVLNSGTTKSVGDEITESDVYVWIPRYKYTIFNGNNGSVSEQLINVTFESGTNSTGTVKCVNNTNGSETCTDSTNGSVTNGTSTYTHPAFTFGSTNLTGFWVGKFEVSGSTITITVKPNVSSLRSTTVSSFFMAIKNIETTYSISNADSHMIKNMEWGAVAYFKQSKYGLGLTQVGINNNSSYITGCGAAVGSSESTTCNAYNTSTGMLASTTGNIYGVYDMSGGAWEYVMGNMLDSSNAFCSDSAGFSTAPASKYYDTYKYDTSNTTHARGKLGDATKETLSSFGSNTGEWYSDYAIFPTSGSSWFKRGGRYSNASTQGVFSFDGSYGFSDGVNSTRAVLTSP